MRFTKDLVRRVADAVEQYTGGEFGLRDIGSDLGNGVRYMDKRSSMVWLGPQGAREACAYYIGTFLEWAKHRGTGEIRDELLWLRDVQDEYLPKQRYRNWEEQGRAAARELLTARGK